MTHFEFKVAFYVSELCKLKLTTIMVYTNCNHKMTPEPRMDETRWNLLTYFERFAIVCTMYRVNI